MDIFDIVGPIMIGPSSSHTAGAVRIGRYALSMLGQRPVKADIYFSGSFAKTYRGHGTDKAVIAGILGMDTDDSNIRCSLELAQAQGLAFQFIQTELEGSHPNTALIHLVGDQGKEVEMEGVSVGGGNILITKVNGTATEISGKLTTILVHQKDRPGMISDITNILARNRVNIGNCHVSRNKKGGIAVMVIEIDGHIDPSVNDYISAFPNVLSSSILNAI